MNTVGSALSRRAVAAPRWSGRRAADRLAADRRVLAIDEQEVGAGRRHRLRRDGRRDRRHDAGEDVALGGEPLLEEQGAYAAGTASSACSGGVYSRPWSRATGS